ncbi:MAG: hypothetical protein ACOVLC_10595 [Flavobacterium sp.]
MQLICADDLDFFDFSLKIILLITIAHCLALIEAESLVQVVAIFLWPTQSDCNELLGWPTKKATTQPTCSAEQD